MSCDGEPLGTRLGSSYNQRSNAKSPETHAAVDQPLVNGPTSVPTSREFNNAANPKGTSTQVSKVLPRQQVATDSKTDRLKAIIQNDKSGNAMRRLQVAAANRVSSQPLNDSHRPQLPSEEPVKPPRRGAAGNKNSKSNRSEDSGSFMDVTAAI